LLDLPRWHLRSSHHQFGQFTHRLILGLVTFPCGHTPLHLRRSYPFCSHSSLFTLIARRLESGIAFTLTSFICPFNQHKPPYRKQARELAPDFQRSGKG
jgi:hypothetical protein